MLQLLTLVVFFGETHVFLQSAEKAYLEQRETISILKYLSCRKHCIQKLTQHSQGINVVEAPASNTDGFLS
jgi:hypothetical protein